jgi:hypothetical protein
MIEIKSICVVPVETNEHHAVHTSLLRNSRDFTRNFSADDSRFTSCSSGRSESIRWSVKRQARRIELCLYSFMRREQSYRRIVTLDLARFVELGQDVLGQDLQLDVISFQQLMSILRG